MGTVDMMTAMILGLSINAIMAVIILITAKQFPPIASKSMKHWSIGLFFLALSYLIFIGFQESAPVIVNLTGQFAAVVGITSMSQAMAIFLKINLIRFHLLNLLLTCIALLVTGLVWQNISATIFITCIGIMLAMAVLIRPLLIEIFKYPSAAKVIIYSASLLFQIVLFFRCFDYFVDPRLAWDFNQISITDVITIIVAVIGPVVSTFGFMMMHQEKAYRELARMASIDSLTKIYNRHAIEIKTQALFKKAIRFNKPISVMLIDLDKFKNINDEFGHAAGDQVLIDIATLIKNCLGPKDLVGRFGGEEFFVLLPESSIDAAEVLAQNLLNDIQNMEHIYGQYKFYTTVSIGVAERKTDEECFTQTLKRADLAMYDAKSRGRNRAIAV